MILMVNFYYTSTFYVCQFHGKEYYDIKPYDVFIRLPDWSRSQPTNHGVVGSILGTSTILNVV